MKRARNVMLLALLLLLACGMLPTGVAAAPNDGGGETGVLVDITRATYLSLESDGVADDVVTDFRVVTSRTLMFQVSYLYCFLELPSGLTYLYVLKVIGTYSQLVLTLGWIDVASESGWYALYIYAEIVEPHHSHWGYDDTYFDPPDGGIPGGPLVVELISVGYQA